MRGLVVTPTIRDAREQEQALPARERRPWSPPRVILSKLRRTDGGTLNFTPDQATSFGRKGGS
jgi:hypothetical protein